MGNPTNDRSMWRQVVVGTDDFAPPAKPARSRWRWTAIAGAAVVVAAGAYLIVTMVGSSPAQSSAKVTESTASGSKTDGSKTDGSKPDGSKTGTPAGANAASGSNAAKTGSNAVASGSNSAKTASGSNAAGSNAGSAAGSNAGAAALASHEPTIAPGSQVDAISGAAQFPDKLDPSKKAAPKKTATAPIKKKKPVKKPVKKSTLKKPTTKTR